MKLLLGFLLGLLVATASSISAEMGTWYDNQGNMGTYNRGPLGTQYQDQFGNQGMIQQWSNPYGYGLPKSPC